MHFILSYSWGSYKENWPIPLEGLNKHVRVNYRKERNLVSERGKREGGVSYPPSIMPKYVFFTVITYTFSTLSTKDSRGYTTIYVLKSLELDQCFWIRKFSFRYKNSCLVDVYW